MLTRLDKLTAAVETLTQGLQETKLETRVFQAQTTERLVNLDQRITDLDKRIDGQLERIEKRPDIQEGRVSAILLAVSGALLGTIIKLVVFPNWPRPAA